MIVTEEDPAGETDKGDQTDIISLDFLRVFHKIQHEHLLMKLDFYGIRGMTKRWARGFFSMVFQQVVVEDDQSYTDSITSGLPQGLVLGPFLFLIYINNPGDGIN